MNDRAMPIAVEFIRNQARFMNGRNAALIATKMRNASVAKS